MILGSGAFVAWGVHACTVPSDDADTTATLRYVCQECRRELTGLVVVAEENVVDPVSVRLHALAEGAGLQDELGNGE
jgi:IMP cyclohydrolase